MALQFQEHYRSGDGSVGRDGCDDYRLLVWGDPVADNADDPATIMLAGIKRFSQVSALGNVITNFHREKIAPGKWIITGSFTSPYDLRQSLSSQFSFTTGGGSTHITHSRQTVNGYGPEGGLPPPNFQGAINVNPDGSVDGLDIGPGTAQGTFEFKTTHYLPTLSPGLVTFLHQNPCVVNSDYVNIGFDGVNISGQPGELQLQYAEGTKRRGFGDWELTLHWAKSPNRTGFYVGNCIVDSKNGWDYMWVYYEQQADTTSQSLVSQPRAVYVEQVYPYAPLNMILMMVQGAGEPPWTTPTIGAVPL